MNVPTVKPSPPGSPAHTERQYLGICRRKRCRVIAAQNGGSARSYQRGLRDVDSQQTGGRLDMQPSSLMNIHASQFCAKNARICRKPGG
jgi:hypothetical protein